MRRLVLQAFDSRYARLSAITSPAIRKWAESTRWDYRLCQLPDGLNPLNSRYDVIAEMLEEWPEVLWLDCDIVPVAMRDIITPNNEVCVSVDFNGMCAGASLWRAGRFAKWLVEAMLLATPREVDHDDQCFLKDLCKSDWVRKSVGEIPETEISNPVTKDHTVSALLHLWSSSDYDGCVRRAAVICSSFMPH